MNEKEETKKLRIKEIVKDGSGLGFLKVTGTALTAVSMAIISSKITGFVNSLMLVAILSIGTAVVNEFYRILLSFTSLGAKRIVSPVFRTVENTETGEMIVVEDNPISVIDVNEIKENDSISQLPFLPRMKKRILQYFKNNSIMKFMLLFSAVAVITIGVNYIMDKNEESSVYTYTTNHTTEKQVIEDSTVQPVIEEKTVVVKEEKVETDENNNNEAITEDANEDKTPIVEPTTVIVPQDDESIEELRSRIESLEDENRELKTEIRTLKDEKEKTPTFAPDDTTSSEEINKQIEDLQKQIDELKNMNSSSSSISQEKNNNSKDPDSIN